MDIFPDVQTLRGIYVTIISHLKIWVIYTDMFVSDIDLQTTRQYKGWYYC